MKAYIVVRTVKRTSLKNAGGRNFAVGSVKTIFGIKSGGRFLEKLLNEWKEAVNMVIAEINKSKTEKIIISIQDFSNRRYIDTRVYFKAEDGTWLPTRKGIKIGMNIFKDFMQALSAAGKELKG